MSQSNLEERVHREKMSHDKDSVLENAQTLKGIFCHVMHSPSMRRCEREQDHYLSKVAGLKILDLGCGFGTQSIALTQKGARVCGIDISENYVSAAKASAVERGLAGDMYEFKVMDAHKLEFPEKYFDLVVGRGILHHLDLHTALLQIKRVLKSSGRAIFLEPLAANPLLKLFRLLTPRARTVDEKPLTPADLDWISREWHVQSSYFGLISAPAAMVTSIVLRPFPNNVFLKMADALEEKVNKGVFFQKYNQYVLLNLVKR